MNCTSTTMKLNRARSRWCETVLVIALLGSIAGGCRATNSSKPTTAVLKPLPEGFFLIGVFGQSAKNPPGPVVWKSRGINTYVGDGDGEQYVSIAEFDSIANANGLKVIRQPSKDPTKDIGNTILLAWMQPDEPDVEGNNINNGCSPYTGQYPCTLECQANFQAWRAADPTRPIFINFSGSDVFGDSSCNYCNGAGDMVDPKGCNGTYPEAAQCYPRLLATGDWISEDIYPVTGWMVPELNGSLSAVGKVLDKLTGWTDKPIYAILETSNQHLPASGSTAGQRGVTPDEFRGEVWDAIIHRARGVIYFPFDVGANSWSYDATPPDVVAEMTRQNALITQLAGTLQGEINPSTIAATVPSPLEAGWRRTDGVSYFFVLNLSNTQVNGASVALMGVGAATSATVFNESSRSANLSGGKLTDDFAPYALHIYVVQ
jgi:hypothetical protein